MPEPEPEKCSAKSRRVVLARVEQRLGWMVCREWLAMHGRPAMPRACPADCSVSQGCPVLDSFLSLLAKEARP